MKSSSCFIFFLTIFLISSCASTTVTKPRVFNKSVPNNVCIINDYVVNIELLKALEKAFTANNTKATIIKGKIAVTGKWLHTVADKEFRQGCDAFVTISAWWLWESELHLDFMDIRVIDSADYIHAIENDTNYKNVTMQSFPINPDNRNLEPPIKFKDVPSKVKSMVNGFYK